jgi:hypothetical protein
VILGPDFKQLFFHNMCNDTHIANGAEEEQSSSPFGRLSDSEFSSQDSGDEDLCSQVGTQTKLQFR